MADRSITWEGARPDGGRSDRAGWRSSPGEDGVDRPSWSCHRSDEVETLSPSVERTDGDFEEWFRSTRPRARAIAVRLAPSTSDPDDITSEAYARALARWSSVGPLPHRDAWLLRVVSNLSIDAVRSSVRRGRIDALQPPPQHQPSGDDDATDRLLVAVALGQLSRRQREVVTLRYLVGLPEAEVAAVLGLSANTVKTHLTRALAALRERLGPPIDEETNLAQ